MSFSNLPAMGQIIVSVLIALIFVVAFAVAYITKDQQAISLLVGAAVAQFSGMANYWLGSSSGSQKKDDTIAQAVASTGTKP